MNVTIPRLIVNCLTWLAILFTNTFGALAYYDALTYHLNHSTDFGVPLLIAMGLIILTSSVYVMVMSVIVTHQVAVALHKLN